jgi:hypothetical protein
MTSAEVATPNTKQRDEWNDATGRRGRLFGGIRRAFDDAQDIGHNAI